MSLKEFIEAVVQEVPAAVRLKGLRAEDRLRGLPIEELGRLRDLVEERLEHPRRPRQPGPGKARADHPGCLTLQQGRRFYP